MRIPIAEIRTFLKKRKKYGKLLKMSDVISYNLYCLWREESSKIKQKFIIEVIEEEEEVKTECQCWQAPKTTLCGIFTIFILLQGMLAP